MKKCWQRLKQEPITLSSILERLIASFTLATAVNVIFSFPRWGSITDLFLTTTVWGTALILLGAFLVLTVLHPFYRDVEKIILIGATFSVFIATLRVRYTINVALVMAGLLLLVIYYGKDALNRLFTAIEERKTLSLVLALLLILGVVGFFIGFVGLNLSYRVLTHSSPNFDYGIFTQMMENMRTTGLALTTVERDLPLSHLLVHASTIWYLVLPVYALFPYSFTLNFVGVVVIASSAVPLFLLAKKHRFPLFSIAVLIAILLLYPYTSTGMNYDIHENVFLLPLILWLLYAYEKESRVWMAVFAGLVLMVKEDAGVFVAFIALYMLVSSIQEKRRKMIWFSAILLGVSIGYFVFINLYLSVYGASREMFSTRYDYYMYDGGSSLFTVIQAVFINPSAVLYQIGAAEKFPFLVVTLIPLLFLPFISKKWERLILIGPYILINLMTDYCYQYDLNFHYAYAPTALFMYLMIKNLSDLDAGKIRVWMTYALLSSALWFTVVEGTIKVNHQSYKEVGEVHREITDFLESIPEDAVVGSSTFYIADLRHVDVLYETYYTDHLDECEYVIFDTRGLDLTDFSKLDSRQIRALKLDPDYVIYREIDGYLICFKRTE